VSLLPWHEPLAERLRRNLREGRLAHALLITGPEGWGERAFANWLALHLIDIHDERDAAGLAHPDLRWAQPDGVEIKVDTVRELETFTHGTPQAGPRKVVVVEDAHFLNRSAANALLKTLEEPPSGTYIVLVTCHPGRLIPTIRSRCQPVVIRPNAELAKRWLETTVAVEDLAQRLFEHGGAPVAVSAGIAEGQRPLAPLLARALDPRATKEVVDALLEQGLPEALGRWYRYVLAMAAGRWPLERPTREAAPSERALMEFADEVTWMRRMLLTSNSANARLLAERLVVRWRDLLRRAERVRTA
jgi:DNA polymerase III subunit delta'